MGNIGGEKTLVVNSGCLEGGRRVTGGEYRKLRTKHGKLLADVRVEEMVHCGGVRAPT